jgi:hypothetical protein
VQSELTHRRVGALTASAVLLAISLTGCGGSGASKKPAHAAAQPPSTQAASPPPTASATTTPSTPSAPSPTLPQQVLDAYAAELTAYLKSTPISVDRVTSTRLVPKGQSGAYNVVMTTSLPARTMEEYDTTGQQFAQVREDTGPRVEIGVYCDYWVHRHQSLRVDLCEVLDAPRSGLGAGSPIDLNPPGPLKTRSPQQVDDFEKFAQRTGQFREAYSLEFETKARELANGVKTSGAYWALIDGTWYITYFTHFPARAANEPPDSVHTTAAGQAFADGILAWAKQHPDAGIAAVRVIDDEFRLTGDAWNP